jgi:hypothetical protein
MEQAPMFATLAAAAVSIAALHSLAPDHWMPFAALARARRWSAARTARWTLLAGLGHVTATLLLALAGLLLGRGFLAVVGTRLESIAGVLLIVFGLTYGAFSLHRAMAREIESRAEAKPPTVGAWGLVALFCLDPCVAVIPLVFTAAPLGIAKALLVVLLYGLTTMVTMLLLVLPARAGLKSLRWSFLDHYGDAAAGGTIALVGVAVMVMGW